MRTELHSLLGLVTKCDTLNVMLVELNIWIIVKAKLLKGITCEEYIREYLYMCIVYGITIDRA